MELEMIRYHTKSTTWVENMDARPNSRNRRRRRHRPKAYEGILVIVFLSLVCFLGFILIAGLLSDNNSLSAAQAYAQQTLQALNAAPTPTPFQPIANSNNEESIPESQPTQTPTEIPLQKPEGQVNILFLGSDARPDSGGFRTDTIIWVSLNPKDGFVSAISFPRDLFIEIPGMGSNRINVAFPRGGFDLLADTLELNYGIRPDHYILIDFYGFKSLINNLGGITVQTAQNLTDSCVKTINPSGVCSVGPGPVQMNGEVALWYARSRYSTNDIDRARRAQEVIEAIFRRLVSLDAILQAQDLYNNYTSYVQTGVSLIDVISLIPLANKIYNEPDIRNYVIGFDYVYNWITPQGAQVLVPNNDLIRELMIEALTLK
jgi:polyisoprenyl-teichoic acid--peptidoglycan teichoic acid transferase